jgi:hypothetical protein
LDNATSIRTLTLTLHVEFATPLDSIAVVPLPLVNLPKESYKWDKTQIET